MKVLPFPQHARAMALTYEEIRPPVEAAQFPLLLPVAVVENAVVFPFVEDIVNATEDSVAFFMLRSLLAERGISPDKLTLILADKQKLRCFHTTSGPVYTDPFEDTLSALMDAAAKLS